ncbi:UNVERIFIED_ORG: hypothetical protein ABIB63_000903 [Xanthomonas axonopodis]
MWKAPQALLSHAHQPTRQALTRLPSRDFTRHGCRVKADRDVLAACPAMVGGQGPCSQEADLRLLGVAMQTVQSTSRPRHVFRCIALPRTFACAVRSPDSLLAVLLKAMRTRDHDAPLLAEHRSSALRSASQLHVFTQQSRPNSTAIPEQKTATRAITRRCRDCSYQMTRLEIVAQRHPTRAGCLIGDDLVP